jgi:HemY protein
VCVKAQSYLEASVAIEASRTAHLELARLLDHLERGEEANRHYRAAAAL